MTNLIVPYIEYEALVKLILNHFKFQTGITITPGGLEHQFIRSREGTIIAIELKKSTPGQFFCVRIYIKFHETLCEISEFKTEEFENGALGLGDEAYVAYATLPHPVFPTLYKLRPTFEVPPVDPPDEPEDPPDDPPPVDPPEEPEDPPEEPEDPPAPKPFLIVSASHQPEYWANGPEFEPLVGTRYDTEEEIRTAMRAYIPIGQLPGIAAGITPTFGSDSCPWGSGIPFLEKAKIKLGPQSFNDSDLAAYAIIGRATMGSDETGRFCYASFVSPAYGDTFIDITNIEGVNYLYLTPNVYATGPFEAVIEPPAFTMTTKIIYTTDGSTVTDLNGNTYQDRLEFKLTPSGGSPGMTGYDIYIGTEDLSYQTDPSFLVSNAQQQYSVASITGNYQDTVDAFTFRTTSNSRIVKAIIAVHYGNKTVYTQAQSYVFSSWICGYRLHTNFFYISNVPSLGNTSYANYQYGAVDDFSTMHRPRTDYPVYYPIPDDWELDIELWKGSRATFNLTPMLSDGFQTSFSDVIPAVTTSSNEDIATTRDVSQYAQISISIDSIGLYGDKDRGSSNNGIAQITLQATGDPNRTDPLSLVINLKSRYLHLDVTTSSPVTVIDTKTKQVELNKDQSADLRLMATLYPENQTGQLFKLGSQGQQTGQDNAQLRDVFEWSPLSYWKISQPDQAASTVTNKYPLSSAVVEQIDVYHSLYTDMSEKLNYLYQYFVPTIGDGLQVKFNAGTNTDAVPRDSGKIQISGLVMSQFSIVN